MFNAYQNHLQTEIPVRPGAHYAHMLVLRSTASYAVFKTDGELNTVQVQSGLEQKQPMTRVSIFKRKQSTPERLTGRELLRRYGIHDQIQQDLGRTCVYNEEFCGVCPDCVTYGYAIGDTGSEKSKVYVDTAYSLYDYNESHESFTLNAPFEDGTMTKEAKTTNRFSEQDHVKPGVFFPSVVTLRDPTAYSLAYLINNLRRTKLYGAQTTRTGHMENQILGLVFADGEIFSNLKLTQKLFDRLHREEQKEKPTLDTVAEMTVEVASDLVKQDGVVHKWVKGDSLQEVLGELDTVFTDADQLKGFLTDFAAQTREYADKIGVGAKEKSSKSKKAAK